MAVLPACSCVISSVPRNQEGMGQDSVVNWFGLPLDWCSQLFFNFLNVPDLFDGRVNLNGFYSSIGRFWEFSAGVLANIIARRLTLPKNFASLLSILGLLAIISSFFLFEAAMQTPGRSTLVPIAGTVLVILGGSVNQESVITRLISIRPLTWVGDLSYSIYLWHWPIIFFWKKAGFVVSPLHGAFLLLITLGLSWLTYRLVESPSRRRVACGR